MDTPNPPRDTPPATDDLVRAHAWQVLKEEMELLHARLEYLHLMLKLEARRP